MEQTPLLSDERVKEIRSNHDHALSVKASAYVVRDLYEADRAKTRALLQMLVDTLQQISDEGTWSPDISDALSAAAEHGITPSQP